MVSDRTTSRAVSHQLTSLRPRRRGLAPVGIWVPGAVPARCDERGLLLIGDPPDLGSFVLPGNNYHVYDIPLFWRNVREDVVRRVSAWTAR